jgi:tetratricopeptide (TPR) repeat protein
VIGVSSSHEPDRLAFGGRILPVLLSLVLAASLTAVSIDGRADPDPRNVAKAKLVEGGDLLKQGEYQEALDRFKEAYGLFQSPKIYYNFGLAYIGLGRNADAMEAFDKFLGEALDASADLRANAERHRTLLSQKVGTIVVECDVEGAEVAVDGRSLGVTPLKTPARLDPGPHQLVVEKSGSPPFAKRLDVSAGQRLTIPVTLVFPVEPPPAPPLPTPSPVMPAPQASAISPGPATEPRWRLERKLAWAAGAVGVGFLALGVLEQLSASSNFQKFNDATPAPLGRCDADDRVLDHGGAGCSQLLDSGHSASHLALLGFVGAGALAATSVVLFVLDRRDQNASATTAALACAPSLPPQGGAVCAVRF